MRRKDLTRREFIERTAAGLAGAQLIPLTREAKASPGHTMTGTHLVTSGSTLGRQKSLRRFYDPQSGDWTPCFGEMTSNAAGGLPEFADALGGFPRPGIFPVPQQMTLRGAPFALNEDCTLAVPLAASTSDVTLARSLTEELSDRYDLQLKVERSAKLPTAKRFIVAGSLQNPLVREFCHRNHLEVTAQSPGPEGYVLHADENAVVIAGSDERGAFYGLQSLRQLIAGGEKPLQVPGVQVRDWPDKPFRGVKLYVPGRSSIAYFRRFIREVMTFYKFNTLMMEMNACMRLERHPEINSGWVEFVRDTNYSRLNYPPGALHGREQNSSHQDCGDGSFLEKDEVAELVRWVKAHYIEVVPEIPTFTHSFYLLARHKDLTDVPGDKWPDTYCPSEPRSYQLIFEVMDEYIEVMKPRLLHAGHDEWFAPFGICPRCKGKDFGGLYGQDLRRIHDYLADKNIKMAIWGDYLLERVRGKGLQKRTAPDGWQYTSPGAMTPQQVKDLVPKDILLYNWFWGMEDGGQENEARLDEWGFHQVYGNMEPGLENYLERSKRKTIIGGAPSSWAATTEFNMSKDMIFSIIGCGNMLWSKKALEMGELARTTQSSIPVLMSSLTGVTPPSVTEGAVTPLDISSAFNATALDEVFGVDFRGIKTGRRAFGPYVFDLAGTGGKVAVMVGTEGTQPNSLPREVTIKVGEDATSLLFLHACAVPATNKEAYRLIWDMADSADLLGWYEVIYEDGLPEVIPIRYGVNILEWNWGRDKMSGKYCYDAQAVICSESPQHRNSSTTEILRSAVDHPVQGSAENDTVNAQNDRLSVSEHLRPTAEHPITFFVFEWESPRLGKVIREVRLKGSTRFRGAVAGFENFYGDVIPNNAVILKAVSLVKKRA